LLPGKFGRGFRGFTNCRNDCRDLVKRIVAGTFQDRGTTGAFGIKYAMPITGNFDSDGINVRIAPPKWMMQFGSFFPIANEHTFITKWPAMACHGVGSLFAASAMLSGIMSVINW